MRLSEIAGWVALFRRPGAGLVVLLALVVGVSQAVVRAHDVPTDVIVRVLVKPEGNRLRVLVRVPMVAMQDMDFPLHGPGYLTIPDLPGLGVELDRDKVARYCDNAAPLFAG